MSTWPYRCYVSVGSYAKLYEWLVHVARLILLWQLQGRLDNELS